MSTIISQIRKILERQQYRLIGNHSCTKICHWTKKSLKEGRVCYKEKWYKGVKSHRCLQLSTSTLWCSHKCLWCWRLQSGDRQNLKWRDYPFNPAKIDDPKEILDGCIEARKLLLTGFKGFSKVDVKKWKEAIIPTNVAISLVGESLLYEKIDEFIQECHKRKLITFLVTNGTLPEKLNNLIKSAEPTQLYITLPAPDKRTYLKACRPLIKDGWKKLNESLELMKSFNCSKVIRLTLVKGLSLKDPEKYAKLILKAEPDFIEPKGFVHVGEAQKRLPRESMPSIEEVKKFAEKLSDFTGYKIKDEDKASRVVLLTKG